MFGFPGAGKETVTKPLIASLQEVGIKTTVMEVGDIVRSHIRRLTEFGCYVKTLSKGGLVPDGRIIPVIQERIGELDTESDWFLDGFPRSVAQVPAYEGVIEKYGRTDLMIYLQLDPDPQIEREISEGRMRLRGELAMANGKAPREDDVSPIARKKRLEESAVLYDVAACLREQNKVIVVDASRAKDVVCREIFDLFQLHREVNGSKVNA